MRRADLDEYITLAKRRCRESGRRWTNLRELIYESMLKQGKPISAYGLLDALAREQQQLRPAPLYRTLQFLMEAQLVHKLDRSNTYVACTSPKDAHGDVLATVRCSVCGEVRELAHIMFERMLTTHLEDKGYRIEAASVEATGVCSHCRAKSGLS